MTDFRPEERIVAFLDILGFKNIVYNEKAKAREIMIEMEEVVKSFQEDIMEDDFADSLKITWFSDSIIISEPYTDISMYQISSFLGLIQNIQSDFLIKGILIRGGVTIGECFHGESERLGIANVFGEAMIESYLLEEKESHNPRVIISKKLGDIIEEKMKNTDIETSDVLIKDADNYWYIEYIDEIMNRPLDSSSYSIDRSKYENVTLEELYSKNIDDDLITYNKWSDFMYHENILPIRDFIDQGLLSDKKSIKKKYEWLAKRYNKSLKLIHSRATDSLKIELEEKGVLKEIEVEDRSQNNSTFNVKLDVSIDTNNDKSVISGYTNLPDDTELLVRIQTIAKKTELIDQGFTEEEMKETIYTTHGQDKATVKDGKFVTTEFSNQGSSCESGEYIVTVSIPMTKS